jgi:hypothetical protein
MGKFIMQMGGLCPDCSGPVDGSIDICEAHEPDGVCPNCGRRDEIQARWVCTTCKNAGHGPPGPNLALHPRVVAFYADRGLDIGYDTNDFRGIVRMLRAMSSHEQEVVSTDPIRIGVTIRYEGDRLRVIIDESMNILELEE